MLRSNGHSPSNWADSGVEEAEEEEGWAKEDEEEEEETEEDAESF